MGGRGHGRHRHGQWLALGVVVLAICACYRSNPHDDGEEPSSSACCTGQRGDDLSGNGTADMHGGGASGTAADTGPQDAGTDTDTAPDADVAGTDAGISRRMDASMPRDAGDSAAWDDADGGVACEPRAEIPDGAVHERGAIKFSDGRAEGEGDFDVSLITRALKQRLRAHLACYERELENAPGLQGQLRIALTIDTRGTASDVQLLGSSLCHPGVEGCVLLNTSRLRFNPGPEGGSVRYTFTLEIRPSW